MATYTGNFNGPWAGYSLRLTVNQGTQNVNNNTTVANYSLVILESIENWAYSSNYSSWALNINGSKRSGSFTFNFGNYNSLTLASGSFTIGHNANGTKTISSSASASVDVIGSASASGSLAFTTIPRATTPSVPSSMVAGNSYTIGLNSADGAFRHDVAYTIGSIGYTNIVTNIAGNATWVPPISLLQQFPDATSRSGTIRVYTRSSSGGTIIGTKTAGFTLSAPASAVPSFDTITHSEANSDVPTKIGAGTYVQLLSRLNLAITGAAGYEGSTIKSYSITVGSNPAINAASGTTSPLINSGSITITGTITDTRNRTATKTVTIDALPYSKPTIKSLTLRRADALGNLDEQDGDHIRIDFVASTTALTNGIQKNTRQYKIFIKKEQDSYSPTPTVVSPIYTQAGTSWSVLITPEFITSVTEAWDVRVEIYDAFSETTYGAIAKRAGTIATGKIFMHWKQNVGLGIGKYHQYGALDVNGDLNTQGLVADEIVTGNIWLLNHGFIESASQATVNAGTSTVGFVTPFTLSNYKYSTGKRLAYYVQPSGNLSPGSPFLRLTLSGLPTGMLLKIETSSISVFNTGTAGVHTMELRVNHNSTPITTSSNAVNSVRTPLIPASSVVIGASGIREYVPVSSSGVISVGVTTNASMYGADRPWIAISAA